MEYFRTKIAGYYSKRISNSTTVDENASCVRHLSGVPKTSDSATHASKASLRPVLGDTSNIQHKKQSTAQKHHSVSSITDTTTSFPPPPPLSNVDDDFDPAHKRRRLQDGYQQQRLIEPFPVLPIQHPEHLHSLSLASSTRKRTSSSVENHSTKTKLYEKGVPPLQVFDFNNEPHHRPVEPFACAKNQMGWINAPAVVEYEHDIYQHLREIETKTLPDHHYATYYQPDFSWETRSLLVNWMIALHARFRLRSETLYLSVNIADRFLSRQLTPMDDLNLIIITSLVIGCKYEEGSTPCITQLIEFADSGYTEKDVHDTERHILDVIHYNLAYSSPLQFWRRIIKNQPYGRITYTIAQYLMEISLVDYHFLPILPSKIAAAAVYLSRCIERKSPLWTKEFSDISGYSQVIELKQVAQLMLNYLAKPIEDTALFRKWDGKQLLGISSHVRDWMLLYHRNMKSK